jgi:hypothetical protein
VLDAATDRANALVTSLRTDDPIADLRRFVRRTVHGAQPDVYGPILRALMAEAQIDPELGRAIRARFINVRRRSLVDVLRRLPGAHSDRSSCGTIWCRLLLDHAPLTPAFADSLVALAQKV